VKDLNKMDPVVKCMPLDEPKWVKMLKYLYEGGSPCIAKHESRNEFQIVSEECNLENGEDIAFRLYSLGLITESQRLDVSQVFPDISGAYNVMVLSKEGMQVASEQKLHDREQGLLNNQTKTNLFLVLAISITGLLSIKFDSIISSSAGTLPNIVYLVSIAAVLILVIISSINIVRIR
jgi:hypothetical protein